MPGGAAAVRHAAKTRRLQKRAAEEDHKLDDWFLTYDKSKTGSFERDEMKALLTTIKRDALNDPTAEVKDKLLDRVMTKFGTEGDGGVGVDRFNAANAVKRYQAWLKHETRLQELFDESDKDKSGVLTKEELAAFLKRFADDRGFTGIDVRRAPLVARSARRRSSRQR